MRARPRSSRCEQRVNGDVQGMQPSGSLEGDTGAQAVSEECKGGIL